MNIRIIRPSLFNNLEYKTNDIFIVIDTFRATTTLATLVNSGVKKIYVVKDKSEAQVLQNKLCNNCLLIGEEEGLKVESFDFGNTPSSLFFLNMNGKEVIFTSSNGAKTLLLLKSKTNVYLGALTNLTAVSKVVSDVSMQGKQKIIILPSGYSKSDDYVLEDWLTALLIARKIRKITGYNIERIDEYLDKTERVFNNNMDIEKLLKDSINGQKLIEMGFEDDVDFAIIPDKINLSLKVKKWLKTNEFYSVIIE